MTDQAAVFADDTDRVVLIHYRPYELTAERLAEGTLVPMAETDPGDPPEDHFWRPLLVDGHLTHVAIELSPEEL